MIIPCPKHVLCPEGTGTESPGVNYSSETIDIPEFRGRYYPPSPYGFYTACLGRCVSLVSQLDADLCAQRLGQLCLNNSGVGPGNPNNTKPPNPVFCNNPVTCNAPNTGRLVVIPADVICAGSQREADAMALSLANILQKDPATPVGPTIIPSPSPSKPPVNVGVPTPTPQPHKPPVPPASQCKPCDDTSSVSSFTLPCNVPASPIGNGGTMYFESPTLKCGLWHFDLVTNNPGSVDDVESNVIAYFAASNPTRTFVPNGALGNCATYPMTWINPCSPGTSMTGCTAPRTTLQWGFFPGCCGDTGIDCGYARCQELPDGNFMPLLRVQYSCASDSPGNSAKKFTINGTWLGPIPPP